MSECMESTGAAADCKVEMANGTKKLDFNDVARDARMSYNRGHTGSVQFREKQLKSLLCMYKEQAHEMALALNRDLGKSAFEAWLFEIEFLKNDVLNVLANFKHWLQPQTTYKRLMDFFGSPQIYREAYGVVLIVGAWNYPLQSTLLPLASAIAAGNCVVLHPPAVTKHTAKFLRENLHNYLDSSCYLLSEEAVTIELNIDYLFFTGALSAAKQLYVQCSKSLIPSTFIVGSQNPVYIDSSANITLTVKRVMWGKCVNAGQTCIAPGYILCNRDVMMSFINEVPKVISEFYGDPKTSQDYARIISEEHFDRLVTFLDGKTVVYGGDYDRKTLYFQPTVLANVTLNFALLYDETYGPILPIVVVDDHKEAITFLRARPKPLALYIFCKNNQVVDEVINQTSSGGVAVNDVLMHFAAESLPFGGVGESGFGRYHGRHTFDTFTHAKSVLKKSLNPIVDKVEQIRYPPYTSRNRYLLKQLVQKRSAIRTYWIKYAFVFLIGMFFGFMINTYM